MKSTELQFVPEPLDRETGPGLPPRSRLYALTPIGRGTPLVEGLLSYVIRLAGAHAVGPRRLVTGALAKACPALDRYRRSGPFFKSASRSVNGLHRFSEYFVEAVEQLCSVAVRDLTLLPLRGLLPFNGPGLFAPSPRWCPACYAEMLEAHTDIYQPLAWSFELYRVCAKHGCTLDDRCPACGQCQHCLPSGPMIGFCCHCGQWLGKRQGPDPPAAPFDLWVAGAIGEIVATLPLLETLATRDRFVSQLGQAVAMFADGSRRSCCMQMGISELSFQYLLSGDKRPLLSLWLEISYGFGLGPVAFLKARFDPAKPRLPLQKLPHPLRCRAKPHLLPPDQYPTVENALRAIAEDADCGMSVVALAQALHLNRSCIRYLWPDLCRQISANYRARKTALAKEVLDKQRQVTRDAVDALLDQGIYPNQTAVARVLAPERISLGHPAVQDAYAQQLKARLGRQ